MPYTPSDISVYTRAAWDDEWTAQPYLYPNSLVETVSPEVSIAELVFDYGVVLRHGESEFVSEPPLDVLNHFVRIVADDGILDWVGVLTSVSESHAGADLAAASGRQHWTARGLEHLLDRVCIRGAWSESISESVAAWIGWTPAFNRRAWAGARLLGNRSNTAIELPHDPEELSPPTTWAFSTYGATWTHSDAIDYILTAHAPNNITWEASGLVSDLDSVDLVFDASGLSVKAALDALIDRRRGYGWTLRYDALENTVAVYVFSVFASDVTSGGFTFHANTEQQTLTAYNRRDIARCVVRSEAESQYDSIVVQGARLKSCFSVAMSNDTLSPAWTEAAETEYLACSSGPSLSASLGWAESDAFDFHRGQEFLSRVFAAFRLAGSWNGECGIDNPAVYDAIPAVDSTGTIREEQLGARGLVHRGILGFIPFRSGEDHLGESFDTDAEPKYLGPQAFLKTREGKWFRVGAKQNDPSEIASGSVRALDREQAVEVRFNPSHLLANNHWTSAAATNVEPEYDYSDLVLTLAIETDERLKVIVTPTGGQVGDTPRELVINVDDAEAWFVAEGTIYGVADDGSALVTFDDSPGFTTHVIRNDKDRLQRIAALALAWYSTSRASARIESNTLELFYEPGVMLKEVETADGTTVTTNSIVTRRAWNFERQTSEISTGWWGVDWARVVPVNAPGLPTPRALTLRVAGDVAASRQAASFGD